MCLKISHNYSQQPKLTESVATLCPGPADKFTSEIDVDRQKFELLLAEKNEQEMEYEEKLKQAEERSQGQLATLDTQYQVCG